MDSNRVRRAADLLLDARARGARVAVAGLDCTPADLDEALAVQALVAPVLGPVGGWKVGAPAPDAASLYSPLPASAIRPSPATFPAAECPMRGIEVEVAYRLARDLPARAAPWTGAEVAEAVDAVLPAIEEVETRLADREAAGQMWHVADGQAHGGLVLGPAHEGWRRLDVATPHVRLAYDGRVVLDRECRNAAGDPFAQVVRLANLAGAHCGGLRAGQIVTTGSLIGLDLAPDAQRVEAEVAGLGAIALSFV